MTEGVWLRSERVKSHWALEESVREESMVAVRERMGRMKRSIGLS